MKLTIEAVDVPDTAKVKPEEYAAVTKGLRDAGLDKAIRFTLPVDEHQKMLTEIRRVNADVTVRSKIEGETVTVWSVKKITRQRRESAPVAETVETTTVGEDAPSA